jgi:AcrR family transcriptional regulator
MSRPALTRERIVAAGVELVTNVGFSGLSLRSVARSVNATVTGVQRQIGMVELVHAVANEVIETMPALPRRGDWHRRVRLWAMDVRAWLTGSPGLARYLLDNRWDAEVALDRLEQVIAVMTDVGLPDAQAVQVGRALYWYTLSHSSIDEASPVITAAFTTGTVAFQPSRWPRLSGYAVPYTVDEAHAQFVTGLDLLLDGVDRQIQRSAAPMDLRPAGR